MRPSCLPTQNVATSSKGCKTSHIGSDEFPRAHDAGEPVVELFVGDHFVEKATVDEPHLARVAHGRSHTRPPRSTADPRDAASSAIYARIHAAGNSATSCAAIAATTRTPNPSLLPIGSSGDCDAENASLRTCGFGLVALPPLQRPTGHRRARVGGPRLTIKGKEIGRWRGPPLRLRALAHPPAPDGQVARGTR